MKMLNRAAHIFVCSLPPILFCFTAGKLMLPLAAAIFMHETAHLTMLKLFGGRMKSFHPAPFGLCMEFDESTLSLGGEAVVSAAGCAVNLISTVICVLLYKLLGIDFLNFGAVSLVLALVNLIPTEPLDGGRLLKILITSIKGPETAYYVTAVFTYIFGFLIFLFASYMLLTSQSGIYPLLFSIYLFGINAKMLEKAVLGENKRI